MGLVGAHWWSGSRRGPAAPWSARGAAAPVDWSPKAPAHYIPPLRCSLHIPQRDHLPLPLGQGVDRDHDLGACLGRQQLVLGPAPLLGWGGPMSGPAVLWATEALGRDRRPLRFEL